LGVLLLALGGCGPRRGATAADETTTSSPPPPAAPTADGSYAVGMAGGRFEPPRLVVPAGETVTFSNTDKVKHAVLPDVADQGGPNSDEEFPKGMKPGDSYQWIAPSNVAVGTILAYHCRYRGGPGDGTTVGTGMAGVLEIGPAAPPKPQY